MSGELLPGFASEVKPLENLPLIAVSKLRALTGSLCGQYDETGLDSVNVNRTAAVTKVPFKNTSYCINVQFIFSVAFRVV